MAERDSPRSAKRARCAIYTRKSTDEGLDLDFNSLDAQREACAAFIASQKHEGWRVTPTAFDDGGFSGGSMARPALQRLLAEIEAGQIDVVVVYKVDRLTRSLADFAKLVEIFDRCGVSFVSITQQFNTTTSMGRLTLNILLSFAQFERELIGERVRDKVAASKKKGMWMGGTVPLGYDVKERKLVVNEAEARTVVDIYERYLRLKSVRALQAELEAAGVRTKCRHRPDGTPYGQQRFARGALYLLLHNRTYIGETAHKGHAYPGEHAAIVEKPLWDAVQAVLAKNRVERASDANSKAPSLLTGLLFDAAGERLTPTWSIKKGTRYRYYVSTALVRGARRDGAMTYRIPAGDLERLVVDRIRKFLCCQGELLDALDDESRVGRGPRPLLERAIQIAEALDRSPDHHKSVVAALVRRIEVQAGRISIDISREQLLASLSSTANERSAADEGCDSSGGKVTLRVFADLRRNGRELKLLLHDAADNKAPNMGLLRIVARAYDVQRRLCEDTSLTLRDIARQENVTAAYLYMLLRLRWLAPDIVAAIVNGHQPPQLTAKKLMRLTAHLPAEWSGQRVMLGFKAAS